MNTRYSCVDFDVMESIEQRVWSQKKKKSLHEMVAFKRILVETFDEHCVQGYHTLKYNLQNHMLKYLRRFQAVSILDSSR